MCYSTNSFENVQDLLSCHSFFFFFDAERLTKLGDLINVE